MLSIKLVSHLLKKMEMHPIWQQKKLTEYCNEKGIHITAYSPIRGQGTVWGTNQVMNSEVLQEIARAKGKSVVQICLRWAYEQGVSLVVKSFNKERMKQNLEIFDRKLSPEELYKI
ncbi:hypothetical protein Pint_22026 [Pistacia integerrima]|uniref:Uncharacterized protein n=1 Tax=Pistacia integerrima TaxID=434235 RepID=A0ACC0YJ70_9ROSI|nr:hypothetical protein Pint_22026 [Pistacia integerrima]